MPLPVTDTRQAFRPLSREIAGLLGRLTPEQWDRPTLAGRWRVRDVVAHLVDTALRRLSFQRDRSLPRTAANPGRSERDLVAFINDLNETWIRAADRLSARVLTDLYARTSADLADFVETLDLDAPAIFPVSWAGESESRQWLDLGREFTEAWHHGAQIRQAVGAGPFSEPRWLQMVLRLAIHALPHAYRDVPGRAGASLAIRVTGPSSGAWTLLYLAGRWDVMEGDAAQPTVTATMSDEVAWRLFFNALPLAEAHSAVRLDGDVDLALPLLRARSVIV
jgi:uncharacterized protein (TIGR03083 family)